MGGAVPSELRRKPEGFAFHHIERQGRKEPAKFFRNFVFFVPFVVQSFLITSWVLAVYFTTKNAKATKNSLSFSEALCSSCPSWFNFLVHLCTTSRAGRKIRYTW